MATRFELVLHGEDPVHLRAAGEEALAEIERLEDQLSLFRPASEIARLNAAAADRPVQVTPSLFALLEHAARLHRETSGAFDITIAPLVRCWGFMHGQGRVPDPAVLAEARRHVGMQLVHLDRDNFTVRFERSGVMLDLGAIGKGYAIERAASTLREAGVSSALLHGGTSSLHAIGTPPDEDAWKVGVPPPQSGNVATPVARMLAMVRLKDEALSVSDPAGKCFRLEDRIFGHVLDPRTGQPADHSLLAAVVSGSATDTDALSTALLTLGPAHLESVTDLRPDLRALVAYELDGKLEVQASRMELEAEFANKRASGE